MSMIEAHRQAFESLQDVIGETIRVRSGSYGLIEIELTAVRGQTDRESLTTPHPGQTVTSATVDFLVMIEGDAADWTPSQGDMITDSLGSQYRVQADSTNKTWRWSGPTKIVMRVHTIPEDER